MDKWGQFTADDGWNILNQARGFKRDRLHEEELANREKYRQAAEKREKTRMGLQTETHNQNMQLGKQQMDMNAQTMGYRENQDNRAAEAHALNAKLKRVNINAANYSITEQRKLAEKADAIETRANEMFAQGSETGSFEFLHSPKNAIDAAAGKLVFDNLKHNEDAGSSYANLHTKRVATNYANNVAPNIDRALKALRSGDTAGFTSATTTAMNYADLPNRLEPTEGGFKLLIRSDANDGKYVDTGTVLSNDEAAQYLAQIKSGEQYDNTGLAHNPAYFNMASNSREATAQINQLNLIDSSKWIPVRKNGTQAFAVPQSSLDDYTAEGRFILVDKEGQLLDGHGFDNPMTSAQLMESGITAMRGLSKKRTPMTEEQVSKEIRALCTTKDGMGNESYDSNRAAVLSRVGGSGGDIHQENQRYDKLVSDGVKKHVRTGAKPEQVMSLVQQQVAEMMLKTVTAKPKGGLVRPTGIPQPDTSGQKVPNADNGQNELGYRKLITKMTDPELEQAFNLEVGASLRDLGIKDISQLKVTSDHGLYGDDQYYVILPQGTKVEVSKGLAQMISPPLLPDPVGALKGRYEEYGLKQEKAATAKAAERDKLRGLRAAGAGRNASNNNQSAGLVQR